MPKADIRKRFAEIWPDAWYEADFLPERNYATLVVIDAIAALRGVNAHGKTWKDVGDRLLKDIDVIGKYYQSATTFVYSYDMYEFVPVAKDPTQKSRTAQAEVGEPEKEMTGFVCGPLYSPIPDDWGRALGHRAKYVRDVIRFFVKYWMTCTFPANLTILVDGHYLRPEDVPQWDISQEDLHRTPIYIGPGKPTLAKDFCNELGEGDFSMPFFLKKLQGEHDSAIVLSIDTDMMSILLALEIPMKIYWRFWPRLSFVPNTEGFGNMTGANAEKWCNISLLKELINADDRLCALVSPVRSLNAAVAASGGDYVDPIAKVTPRRFIDTYLLNASFIQDLCDEGGEINVEAHRRLIRCACVQAKYGNKKEFTASRDSNFDSRFMPSPCDLLYRRKHLEFYMIMILQTGCDILSLPDPRLYGYGRIDRTKPLAKGNIMRLHDIDAPDDFFPEEISVQLSKGEVVDLTDV